MVCLAEPENNYERKERCRIFWIGPDRFVRADKFLILEVAKPDKRKYRRIDKLMDIIMAAAGLAALIIIALKYFF